MKSKPLLHLIATLLIAFAPIFGKAQYNVVITITKLPEKVPTNSIYLSGNFNGWDPKDEKYRLMINSQDRYAILIKDVPADTYEFKFTQGDWRSVETDKAGRNIANRSIQIISDTVLNYSIEGWATGEEEVKVQHTTTPQVQVLDTSFFIPQLNRYRRIWLYLPKGYESGNESYPVIYMHDGQNLFDAATAPFGEWGVDEAMDSVKRQSIIVGIDNGGEKRMNEYNPYDHQKFGNGEGKLYVDFLAKTLKPYIDQRFRTKKDAKNTVIAGSSMGGLISMYAIMKYPKIFGNAGVFSPAFWTAPGIKEDIKKMVRASTHKHLRIFFYAGQQESKEMVQDMLYVFNLMRKCAGPKMDARINAEGKHNEAAWREEFPIFYSWIFSILDF